MLNCLEDRLLLWYAQCILPFDQNVLINITEAPTSKFGEALRQQVEERLLFFEKGEPPSKNADAMRKVLESLAIDEDEADEGAEVDLTRVGSPARFGAAPAGDAQEIPRTTPDEHRIERGLESPMLRRDSEGQTRGAS